MATWAGRKYGHSVTGLLIGLPLNAGPIALFLALEQGTAFASVSSKGILLGAVSLSMFSFVYSMLSKKFHWLFCVVAGWITYLSATFFLVQFDWSLLQTFLVTVASLGILLLIFPKFTEGHLAIVPPAWDIPLRIIMATLFIIALTYVSSELGPRLSGLLGTFPIFGTIFAVTTHYLYGADACIRLMRSVVISLFSFSVFFAVLAFSLQPLQIGYSFLLATACCISSQIIVLYIGRMLKKQEYLKSIRFPGT